MSKIAIIVEEDVLSMRLHSDLLRFNGYTIEQSPGGKNFFELVKTKKPDLILMDLSLSGISGIELLITLRNDDDMKHIPVIAITARDQGGLRDKGLSYDCDAVFSKPIFYKKFLQTIEECVEKKASFLKQQATLSNLAMATS